MEGGVIYVVSILNSPPNNHHLQTAEYMRLTIVKITVTSLQQKLAVVKMIMVAVCSVTHFRNLQLWAYVVCINYHVSIYSHTQIQKSASLDFQFPLIFHLTVRYDFSSHLPEDSTKLIGYWSMHYNNSILYSHFVQSVSIFSSSSQAAGCFFGRALNI